MNPLDLVLRGRQPHTHAARTPRSQQCRLLRAFSLVGLVLVTASVSAQQPRAEQLFERLDRNADGMIDEQELKDARRAAFERADANADGYVDGEELSELADEFQGAGGGRRGALVRERLEQRRGSAGGGERLEHIDTDNDGRISEADFVAARSALLRFDRDGDGRIARAELDRAQGPAPGVKRQRRL